MDKVTMVVATLQKTYSKAFHYIDVQSQMSFWGVLTPLTSARYLLDMTELLVSLGFLAHKNLLIY